MSFNSDFQLHLNFYVFELHGFLLDDTKVCDGFRFFKFDNIDLGAFGW